MIQMHTDYPGNGMTVSEFRRQQMRRFYSRPNSDHLRSQVAETIAELDRRKEQGAKPERVWTFESETRLTPCFADVFGF